MAAVTKSGNLITWGDPHGGKLGHVVSTDKPEVTKENWRNQYRPRNYADKSKMDVVTLEGKTGIKSSLWHIAYSLFDIRWISIHLGSWESLVLLGMGIGKIRHYQN